MDQFTDSDLTPTMAAANTFNNILQQIQSSNLNFQLQISPFSAYISLKKTPAKDKLGVPLSSQLNSSRCAYSASDIAAMVAKNLKLEKEIFSLQQDYSNAVDDCDNTRQKLNTLESQLAVKKEDQQELFARHNQIINLNAHIEQLKKANEECRIKIEDQSSQIRDLKHNSQVKLKADLEDALNNAEEQKVQVIQLERTIENMHAKLKHIPQFENQIKSLENEFENAMIEREIKVKELEAELAKVQTAADLSVTDLDIMKQEKVNFEKEIQYLKISDRNQKALNTKLNKEMIQARNRLIKEKTDQAKLFKKEIKHWKKNLGNEKKKVLRLEKLSKFPQNRSIGTEYATELGNEVKLKIKLEEKLETIENDNKQVCASQIAVKEMATLPVEDVAVYLDFQDKNHEKDKMICSLCSSAIANYIPEYFLGEKFSPACETCKKDEVDPFSSFADSCQPSSLVSHWNPNTYNTFQSPNLIPTMINHFLNEVATMPVKNDTIEELQKLPRTSTFSSDNETRELFNNLRELFNS